MHYYYITGTSRGIGKALAELLLQNEGNYVVGVSRGKSISHKRYEHIQLDLNELEVVKNFQFIPLPDAKSITLINNSGLLGDTKHLGDQDADMIIKTYNVNIVAPSVLMNNFVKAYQNSSVKKTILNISSGAGRHTVESWGTYCASKAALDMFSEVAEEEQQKFSEHKIRVFSVAPGIVDTKMQDEIRDVNQKDFSEVSRFISYKKKGELSSPETVAQKLLKLLESSTEFKGAKQDVRMF